MPRLSVWSIRGALAYLLMGFTFGGLLLANKGIAFFPATWRLLPAHIEFLLVGWVVQLAMGVAFWILPRLGRNQPRGTERLAWLALVALNLGIWLVVVETFFAQTWLTAAGRGLEAAGALAFLLATWRRVKPFG